MEHRLIIEKFGKIERAVIQAAPFTLFVGDNNSGKSYLLSLLWGIYSEDEWSVLFEDLEEQKLYREICERISSLVLGLEEGPNQEIRISSEKLLKVLNHTLDRNKDRFVSGIFNAKQVSIQRLSVEIPEKLMENLGIDKEDVISIQDVAVYQLTDRGTHSVVDKIPPTDGEFKVETFTNALMKILAQTCEVQDFEGE